MFFKLTITQLRRWLVLCALSIVSSFIAAEIILVIWSFALHTTAPAIQKKDSNTYTILTLGESTTAGYNPESWPMQVEEQMKTLFPKKQIQVVNAAIIGAKTNILVWNLEKQLIKYKPDIVVSMMGINDGHEVGYEHSAFIPNDNNRTPKSVKFLRIVSRYARLALTHFYDLHISRNTTKLNAMGDAYRLGGDYTLAELYLKRCIAIEPDDANHYVDLSIVYRDMFRNREQRELLFRALQIAPSSEGVYTELGNYYREMDMYDAAKFMFKKALAINPEYGLAYAEYSSLLYFYFNDKAESFEMFKKSIWYSSEMLPIYLSLAQSYWDSGLRIRAKELYSNILLVDPVNQEAKQKLTLIQQIKGEDDVSETVSRKLARPLLPMTEKNYLNMIEILEKYQIPLIMMQYPLRSAESLHAIRTHLNPQPTIDMYIIENVDNFQSALTRFTYDDLFVDRFAENFGHATKLGNSLISENVTRILRERPELMRD